MRLGATTRGRHLAQPDHRWLPVLVAVAVAMAMVATAPAEPADATHFRAAQLNWTAVGPTTAEFESTVAARRSFFGAPNVGDPIFPIGINYGDGGSETPEHTVVAVDIANDWLLAEATFQHEFSTAGPFVASMSSCCRLSGPQHINNPDGQLRIETIVDFGATTANPVSAVAPIVDCPLNALCQFSVPGFDPDGQAMSFRLATDLEASGFGGGFTQPPGATIDAATGLYSWDTTGVTTNATGDTFYSTQVMIDNVVGGVVGTKTAVDFFIRLGTGSANQQPQFVAPTPADGTVINTTVGATVSFDVEATDPDTGDTVTLSMLGKPAAATYSTVSGNPATGSFSWVPASTQTVILTLQAQDQFGLGATPRSITINVTAPSANQPPEVDAGSDASGVEGSPIALAGSASDPDADTLAIGWSYTAGGDVDAGATCAFSAPSAVSTDITCTDDGTYTVTLSADDGTAPAVTDTATVTVTNANPSVTIGAPAEGAIHQLGAAVNVSAGFTDAGANDTHTCTIDWGDGSVEAGTIGAGTCSGSHAYAATGDHTITVTVTDDDGGVGSDTVTVTVVDEVTKVTGGGFVIDDGKTSFGLVVMESGGSAHGKLQVRTPEKNRFHGDTVSSLTTTGDTAHWTGEGRWNGSAGYTFEVTVWDNRDGRNQGPADQIHIVIRDGTGAVVFEAGPADLGGGNIVVH